MPICHFSLLGWTLDTKAPDLLPPMSGLIASSHRTDPLEVFHIENRPLPVGRALSPFTRRLYLAAYAYRQATQQQSSLHFSLHMRTSL